MAAEKNTTPASSTEDILRLQAEKFDQFTTQAKDLITTLKDLHKDISELIEIHKDEISEYDRLTNRTSGQLKVMDNQITRLERLH